MRIHVHFDKLDETVREFKLDAVRAKRLKKEVLYQKGLRTKRYAKANIQPIYGGGEHSENLRQSIHRRTGKDFVVVSAVASYAEFVELGTKPSSTGYPRSVYIKGVGWRKLEAHPGARGYPSQAFMRRAVARVESEEDTIIRDAITRIYGGK